MSIHTLPTRSQAGDFISERCARRITAHRRTVTTPEAAVVTVSHINPAATAHRSAPTASSETGARILRRWSVAELIYSAAARQPVVA